MLRELKNLAGAESDIPLDFVIVNMEEEYNRGVIETLAGYDKREFIGTILEFTNEGDKR